MFPVGPATRSRCDDAQPDSESVARFQQGLEQAGEGVVHAVSELETALDALLTGAPRDVAVPLVCCAASAHALYTRLVLVGGDPTIAAERSPAGLFVYLTVQALALTALFHAASVAENLLRWQRGEGACGRLTALVHGAAPLVYGLALYLCLAFYKLVWNDEEFRAHVLLPKERAGLPIHQWMHETHLGPVAVSLLDVMGGHNSDLWAQHTARPGLLIAAAVGYGAAYTALCHAVAHSTGGGWPYPFMARLTAGGRVGFCAVSGTVLSLLTLAWRRIIQLRCRAGMPPQGHKTKDA